MKLTSLQPAMRILNRAVCLALLIAPLWTTFAFAQAGTKITIDQAIQFALANNPSIKATRTVVDQSKAVEVTAGLRPNPVLLWDAQFIPAYNPSQFTHDTLNNQQQFDIGLGYLFERGGKRHRRMDAARDQTNFVSAQISDAERALTFSVAQQFINALLAQSNLDFAEQDLKTFSQTVRLNEERLKEGDISKNDYLKIKIQLLQSETAVTAARLAKVQALASLRQLIGYDSVPRDYDVAGNLQFQKIKGGLDDLAAMAFRERPDLRAAKLGVTAAQSQFNLAKANGKPDLSAQASYTHVGGVSSLSTFFNIPLPIFNRNQGEIARTRFVVAQSNLTEQGAEQGVLTDVKNAYEAVQTNQQVVDLYESGYLKQAQESRDITEYAYRQGSAALLDFLDAERSYRATELAYRQSLAGYMLALEQLRGAVGNRNLP